MAKQQGGNFKCSKHQRSKKKKNTGQSKQDGGILPWLLFKGLSSRRRRRPRRCPSYYSQPPPQPYQRQPRSMYISVNNTQFSQSQKMYKPPVQQEMGTNRYKMYNPQPQKQTGL
jgi:hypothetical protein